MTPSFLRAWLVYFSMAAAGLIVLPAGAPARTPPLIVEARYPGASAQVVEDVVQMPLWMQLYGAEGICRISSLCTSDGRCLFWLEPDPKRDRTRVRTVVAERLGGAKPLLPAPVLTEGITILPDEDEAVIVVAVRPTGRPDLQALSDFALRTIRPRLEQVADVAQVIPVGQPDARTRVVLDPARLQHFGISSVQVAQALRQALGGQPGKPASAVDSPSTLEKLVVGTRGGQPRLKDVAKVEVDPGNPGSTGVALREGEKVVAVPAVLLLVRPRPGGAKAVKQALANVLSEVERKRPGGLAVDRFTFGPNDLTATLRTPERTAPEEWLRLFLRTAASVMHVPEVRSVCWLPGPDEGEATLLLSATDGDRVRSDVRTRMAHAGAEVTVGAFRPPLDQRPSEGAQVVVRISGDDLEKLRKTATDLRKQMTEVKGVVDLILGLPERKEWQVVLSNEKITHAGLYDVDVGTALQIHLGTRHLGNYGPGQGVSLSLPTGPKDGKPDLGKILVQDSQHQQIPMKNLVAEVRQEIRPLAIHHVDQRRAFVVSCNVEKRPVHEVRRDVAVLARRLSQDDVKIDVEGLTTPAFGDLPAGCSGSEDDRVSLEVRHRYLLVNVAGPADWVKGHRATIRWKGKEVQLPVVFRASGAAADKLQLGAAPERERSLEIGGEKIPVELKPTADFRVSNEGAIAIIAEPSPRPRVAVISIGTLVEVAPVNAPGKVGPNARAEQILGAGRDVEAQIARLLADGRVIDVEPAPAKKR